MSQEAFEEDYRWIANRLKQLRKEKGFNNYEHFAYELGMSRSAYWRLEKGQISKSEPYLESANCWELRYKSFSQFLPIRRWMFSIFPRIV